MDRIWAKGTQGDIPNAQTDPLSFSKSLASFLIKLFLKV
jgi:hypothetical protein